MAKSVDDKFKTVIEKNTFYFFNRQFEERYEGYINPIRESLLVLKNEIETKGLTKDIFERLLANNENGLTALLALTGFSNESLKRLITLIRVVDDPALSKLSLKEKWHQSERLENVKEWSDLTIARRLNDNEFLERVLSMCFLKAQPFHFWQTPCHFLS